MRGEQQRGQVRHYSVRPLDEQKNGLSVPRLLNVALSRSKKELVVIADMGHINKVYGKKFLGRLLNRMVPKELTNCSGTVDYYLKMVRRKRYSIISPFSH